MCATFGFGCRPTSRRIRWFHSTRPSSNRARGLAQGCGPMADALPAELSRLLGAGDAPARDEAWAGFVRSYSPLLIHVTRFVCRSHDAAMDAYAFVLEQLRQDDLRRNCSSTNEIGRAHV